MPGLLFKTVLKKVECIEKGREQGEGIEFYAGQQLTIDSSDSNEKLVTQAFTTGTKVKEGYKIKEGKSISMKELELSTMLPDVTKGQRRLFSSRFYAFENDSKKDIVKIKGAFSNDLLAFMTANADEPSEDKVKQAFEGFLAKENLANLGFPSKFQPIPLAIFNLVDGLVQGLLQNDDDVIGNNLFQILYTVNAQGELEYRLDLDGTFGEPMTGEQVINQEITLKSANTETEIKCLFQLQIIPFS